MKPGKVSETIYKRSILKGIHHRVQEVCQAPGVGIDACVHQALGEICPVTSAVTVTGIRKKIGGFALYRAVNCLAAMGAVGKSVWVNLLFPEWFMESDLKIVIKELDGTAAELAIEIAGVDAEVVKGLLEPVAMVSAYGERKKEIQITPKQIKPGMDLVMTKYAGTEGAVLLALEREKELLKRFSFSFVDRVQSFFRKISATGEAAVAVLHGVKAMHTIGEGGVFGALWEIAEAAEVGLEVEIQQIPILQETIEVCEVFHINPYQISATGSLLMVTENGYALIEELRRRGFYAAVIGRITKGKERLLFQEEEKRYLEPPKKNELLKGLTENQVGG